MAATDRPKRYRRPRRTEGGYVFVCVACGCLDVGRIDKITCSTRCRVWLHRHPDRLDQLAGISQAMKIEIAAMQQAAAIQELLGDAVAAAIVSGDMAMDEAQRAAKKVFWKRVMEAGRVAAKDEDTLIADLRH